MLNWWYETMPDWLGFTLFVGIPAIILGGLFSYALVMSIFNEATAEFRTCKRNPPMKHHPTKYRQCDCLQLN